MNISTKSIVSMTDANKNFSKVARVVEDIGEAVIFKNNKPKYLVINMDDYPYLLMDEDETMKVATKKDIG